MGIFPTSSLGCDILYLLLLWMMANKVDDISYNNKFPPSVGLFLSPSLFVTCSLFLRVSACFDMSLFDPSIGLWSRLKNFLECAA